MSAQAPLKCVIWDLDDTLWDGTLLEDGDVALPEDVRASVIELDRRGVLQSLASRAERGPAEARLRDFGLFDYFLYPQFGDQPKSVAVAAIAAALDISLDSVALVDDQAFERDEVRYTHPQVRCFEATLRGRLPQLPEFDLAVTAEASQRRALYRHEERRRTEQAEFVGPPTAFLAGLDLRLRLWRAQPSDLLRAHELTERTHQLNSTGRCYSLADLAASRERPDHLLMLAALEDRFGRYGCIGLVLVEQNAAVWHLRLLLTSCRVVSRGIGGFLLTWLMHAAQNASVALRADFVDTGRNRMMWIAYRFAGFREISRNMAEVVLAHDLQTMPTLPDYLTLIDEV